MNNKICKKCGQEKNRDEYFFKSKGSKDGYENICKSCTKIRRRKRYKDIIYELYCKETNTYYVGQTIKPITERVSAHFSNAKSGKSTQMREDMLKYGRDGFIYKEIENVLDGKLDEREKYWISEYLNRGRKMYNRDSGGRSGSKAIDEVRYNYSRARGTEPFLVFNTSREFLGRFDTIKEANKKLNTSVFSYLVKTPEKINKNRYIVIQEDKFTEDTLTEKISEFERKLQEPKIKKYKRKEVSSKKRCGENNPMYGKKGKLSTLSKSVVVVHKDHVEYFDSSIEVSEKYKFQARYYARGGTRHYYKKLDIYVYYEEIYNTLFGRI